jgi:methionine synthase II (cobalamin-independent)
VGEVKKKFKSRKTYIPKPKPVSKRLQKILSVIFALNLEILSPDDIMESLSVITSNEAIRRLLPNEKIKLKLYLKKWGYDTTWLDK